MWGEKSKTGRKLCSEFLVIVAMSSSFGNKNSVYLRQEMKVFLGLWGYLRACSCPAMIYGSILLSPTKLKSVHHGRPMKIHWIRIQFRSLKHHLFYHSFIIVLNVIIGQMQHNMNRDWLTASIWSIIRYRKKTLCLYLDEMLSKETVERWYFVQKSSFIFVAFILLPLTLYKYWKQYYKFLSNLKNTSDPTGCDVPVFHTSCQWISDISLC